MYTALGFNLQLEARLYPGNVTRVPPKDLGTVIRYLTNAGKHILRIDTDAGIVQWGVFDWEEYKRRLEQAGNKILAEARHEGYFVVSRSEQSC